MRKKSSEYKEITGILTLAVVWLAYPAIIQAGLFYKQHPVLSVFFIIFLIVWGGLLVYSLNSYIKRRRNKKWLAIQCIEDMQKLHWREFEEFIAFVLQKKWFKTTLGRGTKDGGVDIEATLDWRKHLVQCKKWTKFKISEPNIREFLWAISDFDIDAKWIYVTTSHLTSDAKIFAERNSIMIWDKYSLEWHIAEFTWNEMENIELPLNLPYNKEVCSKCWGNMMERIAKQWSNKGNMFLGCENYPRCNNIIN